MISDVLLEIADSIESGNFGKKIRIGLTTMGSEHGVSNMLEAANLAKSSLFDIVLIGDKVESDFEVVEIGSEEGMYCKMEELLDSGYIDACVTMHYNFPIGVSTVGRVVTPGTGKEMLLATTTGTTSTDTVEALIKNAVGGIGVAKSLGIESPKVGILNLNGAKQAAKAIEDLKKNGYDVDFAESQRADGGVVMRGNDLLMATPDVMVCDTLTGNIMMKVFSSYTTGGSYEALGYGYGPGVGEGYNRKILIVSRASGAPVVANALRYAYDVAVGNVVDKVSAEYKNAKKAGLEDICKNLKAKSEAPSEQVKMPDKEIVTEQISGIDILDLDDAISYLWKSDLYAESGMGCTGPIVLVNESKKQLATEKLIEGNFISE